MPVDHPRITEQGQPSLPHRIIYAARLTSCMLLLLGCVFYRFPCVFIFITESSEGLSDTYHPRASGPGRIACGKQLFLDLSHGGRFAFALRQSIRC
ncbi:hypothetical protein Y032_0306g1980 [Ancylostoma ceylanicum]|uniref:Uncharacterized protein n=1 Tax=Ancylostoma ceylanicum TaxID=53326 RepID=A0A016S2U9_9BILA|nr:hypothetical protein Y032_0306g1980 [Ancylostoma ceylanicum]